MVFFVAQQSHALGFGEIQVNSYLGEPLKAQVEFVDLANEFEASLKVRLASPEEYKKNGYAYPYDLKFRFVVVNENGKQAMVRISSSQTIEDPFLNLLLEVSSASGKVVKSFTFLIDPSPELLRSPDAPQSLPASHLSKAGIIKSEPAVQAPAVAESSTTRSQNRPARKTRPVQAVLPVARLGKNKRTAAAQNNSVTAAVFGKLSLSLSTSLSISSNDPSGSLNSKENNDILQEELIAKEKTLSDLNAQIAEMHSVIKVLQNKLSLTAESTLSASSVLAQSGVEPTPVVSQVVVAPAEKVAVVSPLAVTEVSTLQNLIDTTKNYYKELLAGLVLMMLVLFGFYWQRKRKLESGWIPSGLFDDLTHTQSEEAHVLDTPVIKNEASGVHPSAPMTKTVAIGEQSIKVPVYKEQKAQTNLPPEYDLLEEADIYLRFGHDKLAEEVLRDALKINPMNPDIYMTLLGIFDTRGDAQGFESVALELKPIADAATWSKVIVMGKKLDIGNALYA